MEVAIIGIVTAFNFIVIKIKFDSKRYFESILDLGIMISLGIMFGGSIAGLMIAMISSFIVSIFLYFNKPKLLV